MQSAMRTRLAPSPKAYVLLGALALLGGASACGGGSGAPPPPVVQRVGPSGATVSGGGASLIFPPGAVSTEVEVSVVRLDETAAAGLAAATIPGGNTVAQMVGSPLELTPHGAAFDIPVHVDMETSGQANLVMRLADREDTTWEVVPDVTFTEGNAAFYINHFSVYAAFRFDGEPPGPQDACSLTRCEGGGVKSCSATAAGCWMPLTGVRVPTTVAQWRRVFLTHSYGADLDNPSAAPYAAYASLGEGFQAADQMALAFFPLRDGIGAADVVQTEPFALRSGGVAVSLTVRAIFAIETGYVVVGEAGRPVLLHVSRGTPSTWVAKEIVPTFTHALPHEYAGWTDLNIGTTPLVAARAAGKLHVIAGLDVPLQSVAPTIHRWTIPLDDLQSGTGGTIAVTTLETSDAFPLLGEDRYLAPVAVGPGPDGTLAISSHGVRVERVGTTDTYNEIYDVRLQLWDVGAARLVAQRSYEGAANATSDETVGGCKTSTVSTDGPGLGHLDARNAVVSDGALENAALMSSIDGLLLYVSQAPTGTSTLARCAQPFEIEDRPLGFSLLSARFQTGPTPAFSGVWDLGSFDGETARFATLSSHDPAGDALTAVVMGTPGDSGLDVLGAASIGDGHRLFAEGPTNANGRQIYVLDVNPDGTIAAASAAK